MQSIDDLLRYTVEHDASDLHLKADSTPYVRIYGDLYPVGEKTFTSEEHTAMIRDILTEHQWLQFEHDLELDFAHEIPGLARFRGNIYQQRNRIQAAFRVIPLRIQTLEELQAPKVCEYFATRPRGFVLVTGPAGSGKSTTQAAMIHLINHTQAQHIVTVEDPIEFVHEDARSHINQREVGHDTKSFANALKFVLRQDPDVILVGEMRDLETIHLAITAAETGHLVFGTLHTVDAVQTVDRVIDVFPMHQQQQVRMQLSVNLVGVISQTLIKRADGKGRIAAFETLVATPAVRNLIRENKSFQIGSIIQTGARQGMQTLDQSIAKLVRAGLVTQDDGYAKSKDPGEFMRLIQSFGDQPGPQPPQSGQPSGPPRPQGGVPGQPNRPSVGGYRPPDQQGGPGQGK
ncbi:MAG: PilT/PilU family type 4a pilus ATPase [Fimbriimonadia bacterium]